MIQKKDGHSNNQFSLLKKILKLYQMLINKPKIKSTRIKKLKVNSLKNKI